MLYWIEQRQGTARGGWVDPQSHPVPAPDPSGRRREPRIPERVALGPTPHLVGRPVRDLVAVDDDGRPAPRAVEKHVTSIFSKLDLPATTDDHRRVLAVLTFVRA